LDLFIVYPLHAWVENSDGRFVPGRFEEALPAAGRKSDAEK
jgi:hypothetical protein